MKLRTTVFVTLLALAGLSFAADLESAKQSGLVGERADGYLGLVDESAAPDVVAMVKDINTRRRAEYERIAASNGLSLEQVEALAGKKTVEKSAPGAYVLLNGGWSRK